MLNIFKNHIGCHGLLHLAFWRKGMLRLHKGWETRIVYCTWSQRFHNTVKCGPILWRWSTLLGHCFWATCIIVPPACFLWNHKLLSVEPIKNHVNQWKNEFLINFQNSNVMWMMSNLPYLSEYTVFLLWKCKSICRKKDLVSIIDHVKMNKSEWNVTLSKKISWTMMKWWK